jgi:GNAT superfamily N-acetyltransferase
MKDLRVITPETVLSEQEIAKLTSFLFDHLEQYGDEPSAIQKAILYANGHDTPGGYILELLDQQELISVAVINKTGMRDYIPENILVYLATHKDRRGQGLGSQLMEQMTQLVKGDIALHVEPDNPAKKLYEKFGFSNKYLEMRLIKT